MARKKSKKKDIELTGARNTEILWTNLSVISYLVLGMLFWYLTIKGEDKITTTSFIINCIPFFLAYYTWHLGEKYKKGIIG